MEQYLNDIWNEYIILFRIYSRFCFKYNISDPPIENLYYIL